LRLLIGASSSKIFHLKEFAKKLERYGVEVKVVLDVDYADGFPNRKISKWFSTNKKFKKLVSEFEPDVIFVDRTKHFALEASKTDIPVYCSFKRRPLVRANNGKRNIVQVSKWKNCHR
tara:strand:+ start:289 stop:642 length:354 start_codon:yes stop_codon:yes gene_type:complete